MQFSFLRQIFANERRPSPAGRQRRRSLRPTAAAQALETRYLLAAFVVTTLEDVIDESDGVLSLREALKEAEVLREDSEISFDEALTAVPGVMQLAGEDLLIESDVTIRGPGADRLTIDAGQNSRVFRLRRGLAGEIQAVISGLTLVNGRASGLETQGDGGAIRIDPDEDLTIVDSVIRGNSAERDGGAISNEGNLTLNNTVVSDNVAGRAGGGIFIATTAFGSGNGVGRVTLNDSTVTENRAAEQGGGIDAGSGQLTVSRSTISNNQVTSGNGGGVAIGGFGTATIVDSTLSGNGAAGSASPTGPSTGQGGGLYNQAGAVALQRSTLSGNASLVGAGGVHNMGVFAAEHSAVTDNTGRIGGLFNSADSTMALTNSTVSGNSVLTLVGNGGIENSGTLSVVNSTVTDNNASGTSEDLAGGIFSFGSEALTLRNSIVAGNLRNSLPGSDIIFSAGIGFSMVRTLIGNPAFTESLHGQDGNIVGQDDGNGGRELIDITTVLLPLAFNGGPTQTHALVANSPAIDAGDNALARSVGPDLLPNTADDVILFEDQRGGPFTRFFNTGGSGSPTIDIGAFERQTVTDPARRVVTTLQDELNPGNDDTTISLREAIAFANGNANVSGPETITFDPTLFAGSASIFLRLGEIPILDDVRIVGPGADRLTIDAEFQSRIFHIDDVNANNDLVVDISGLTLAAGTANDGFAQETDDDHGGAIRSAENLSINNVEFVENFAAGHGGAISNTGSLTVRGSAFVENRVTGTGASANGGAIYNDANATSAIVNSTFSGNSAPNSGGGIFNAGTLAVTNSTLAENAARTGGGITSLSLTPVTLNNTIVIGNFADPTQATDLLAQVSGSNNLIGDPAAAGTLVHDTAGNIIGQDDGNSGRELLELASVLEPLSLNGGPTSTHALVANSPAIDNGSDAVALDPGPDGIPGNSDDTPLLTDQRQQPFARNVDGGVGIGTGTVDIGAWERQQSSPASLVVTTLNDELDYSNADVSLREAVNSANGGVNSANPDTITFAPELTSVPGTITLTLGEILISDSMVIAGPGADRLTVDGNQTSRIFTVDDGSDFLEIAVEIVGLTLTGGLADDGVPDSNSFGEDDGGAIFSVEDLTIRDSTISNNTATDSGGGIYNDGGSVTLLNSTLSDNTASTGNGGGLYNFGTTELTNSTISGNQARERSGGGIFNEGSLTLHSSTVTGNLARENSDNQAPAGGFGGGIYGAFGDITLNNTIVAGNHDTDGTPTDINKTFSASLVGTSSLIGDPRTASGLVHGENGIIIGQNGNAGRELLDIATLLSPLAIHGGPTPVHMLVPGSPAIDQGDSSVLPAELAMDQQGFVRVIDLPGVNNADAGLDIGAVEAISVSIASVTASESAGTLDFVVTLSDAIPAGKTVKVLVSTSDIAGQAVANADYTALSGELVTFSGGGDLTQIVSVPITADSTVELTESLGITLSSAAGAFISQAAAVGTINDSDTATFTIDDVSVNESAGTLDFTLSVDNPLDIPISIDVSFADVDTEADDFDHTLQTINFAANDGADKTVSVPIINDTTVEMIETFTASLAINAGTAVGTRTVDVSDTATGTITDNDTATFTIDDVTVSEADGTATFTVSVDNPLDIDVMIDVNYAAGTANGADFDGATDTVTFAAGSTTAQTVTVAITNDDLVELTETFTVSLAVNAATAVGTRTVVVSDTATGTITDDEVAGLTLTIFADAVDEDGGTTTATVTRNSDTTDALIINLSSSDTDEVTVPETVTIPAGQTTSEPFTLAAVDDTDVDGTQTVTITASVTGFVSGTDTLDVTDNDPVTRPAAVLDIDGSGGNASAQSDGLLVFAALSGVTDDAQLASFVSPSATATTSEVLARVDELRTSLALDVDGNGVVSAQSDGLLIFAILSGVTDPTQLSGLIAPDAPRTVPQIIAAVQALRSPPGVAAASSPAAEVSVLADSAATDDPPDLFKETPHVSVPVPGATAVAERNHSAGARRVSWPKSTRFNASDAVTSAGILSDDQSPFPDLEALDGVFHALLEDDDFLLFG